MTRISPLAMVFFLTGCVLGVDSPNPEPLRPVLYSVQHPGAANYPVVEPSQDKVNEGFQFSILSSPSVKIQFYVPSPSDIEVVVNVTGQNNNVRGKPVDEKATLPIGLNLLPNTYGYYIYTIDNRSNADACGWANWEITLNIQDTDDTRVYIRDVQLPTFWEGILQNFGSWSPLKSPWLFVPLVPTRVTKLTPGVLEVPVAPRSPEVIPSPRVPEVPVVPPPEVGRPPVLRPPPEVGSPTEVLRAPGVIEIPVAPSPPPQSQGEKFFRQQCAACHGTDATGSDSGPSLRDDRYKRSSFGDDRIFQAVQWGARQKYLTVGHMEPVRSLSAWEVYQIIQYIRWVQREDGLC